MDQADDAALRGLRVVFLSWRDTRNPEGGGAERALEEVARGLVERGAQATIFCASHAGAPPEEVIDGVRFVRRGSKLTVYPQGMSSLLRGLLGKADVVVDVQNGMPFFSRLVSRKPIIVLVHHVHREQWPVVYPGVTGRVGWWVESRFAPRLYRAQQYVTGSRATRDELGRLGVDVNRIAVVHYGAERQPQLGVAKTTHPSICVVGRLVPHKQVEHAIDAAADLRRELPGLTLTVVGSGWWEGTLHAYVEERGYSDFVEFTGHIDEAHREEIYERSWVLALPSLKEGWGLVVGEAALAGTPAVAYSAAGGTRESILDGVSGLLVDGGYPAFVAALRRVLTDEALRAQLSAGALEAGKRFTWAHTRERFADVVARVARGQRVATLDEQLDRDYSVEP
ncbi:MAG: glycosyltransferase family 4 protein [Nocardioides sp.]|uniref:glycosyltransferase family 4 protein n=1 Tax=Nocardioides sp. TaxID=35761 RepID=UPI0039E4CA8D